MLLPPDGDGPSPPSGPVQRVKKAPGSHDLEAALHEPASPEEVARMQRWALGDGDRPARALDVNRWILMQARPAAASNNWASRGRSGLLVRAMARLMSHEVIYIYIYIYMNVCISVYVFMSIYMYA